MAGSVGTDKDDLGFQIAPMVDVVFVLMLFFMASAGMQVTEKEIGMNLPSQGVAAPNRPAPPPPIIIEIQDNGQVVANNRVFDNPQSKQLPELRAWLENILATDDKAPVIIRPTPNVTHERVIDVLNSAAASKVKNLTFG